jgi:hypothetical protein
MVREETNEPLVADHRNFYKVKKWTKDSGKVDLAAYSGRTLTGCQIAR